MEHIRLDAQGRVLGLTLAGIFDFNRLVLPALRRRFADTGILLRFPDKIWKQCKDLTSSELRIDSHPASGARNPIVQAELKLAPASGHPSPAPNATCEFKWPRHRDRQPVFARIIGVPGEFPIVDGKVSFPCDARDECPVIFSLFGDAVADAVYGDRKTPAYERLAGCVFQRQRDDDAKLVAPLIDATESICVAHFHCADCPATARVQWSYEKTFGKMRDTLQAVRRRVDSEWKIRESDQIFADARHIHTDVSAGLALRSRLPLRDTAMSKFVWMFQLRYLRPRSAEFCENVAATLLYHGFKQSGFPDDDRDVLVHAFVAYQRAVGYLPDAIGDNLLELWKYSGPHPAAGDCEDSALMVMFLYHLFLLADPAVVAGVLRGKGLTEARVRRIFRALHEDIEMVFCTNMHVNTDVHDFALMIRKSLFREILATSTDYKRVTIRPEDIRVADSVIDLGTRMDDPVADVTLGDTIKSDGLKQLTHMYTTEGYYGLSCERGLLGVPFSLLINSQVQTPLLRAVRFLSPADISEECARFLKQYAQQGMLNLDSDQVPQYLARHFGVRKL